MIEHLTAGDSIVTAAIKAGYSPKYATHKIKSLLAKDNHFKRQLIEVMGVNELLKINKVIKLEDAVIDYVNDRIEKSDSADMEKVVGLLPKLAHTIKQKKQIAGLLKPDIETVVPQFQVVNIQNYMAQINGST
jgi:hypothetical protein